MLSLWSSEEDDNAEMKQNGVTANWLWCCLACFFDNAITSWILLDISLPFVLWVVVAIVKHMMFDFLRYSLFDAFVSCGKVLRDGQVLEEQITRRVRELLDQLPWAHRPGHIECDSSLMAVVDRSKDYGSVIRSSCTPMLI